MYRLTIQNFQSIQNATLEFEKFVVITGKSNLGKSAIRRAIQTILFNIWDKSYIKENARQTTITFSKDKELFLQCEKSNTKNHWIVNDLAIPKLNKDAPPISTHIFTNDLNIDTQLSPLFMVAHKDTNNTQILNEAFNAITIQTAQGLCALDLHRLKSNTKDLQLKLESTTKTKAEADRRLSIIQNYYNDYSDIKSKENGITQFINLMMSSKELFTHIRHTETKLHIVSNQANQAKRVMQVCHDLTQFIQISQQRESIAQKLYNIQKNDLNAPKNDLILLSRYLTLKNDLKRFKPQKNYDFTYFIGTTKLINYIKLQKSKETTLAELTKIQDELKDIDLQLANAVCPACKRPYAKDKQ